MTDVVVSLSPNQTRVIRILEGPKGPQGDQGEDGAPGADGASITVRGPWASNQAYSPGDAVTSRTVNNPGLTALWIVMEGKEPEQGVPPHEALDDWTEIGAAEVDSTTAGVVRITQASHPFQYTGQIVAFSEVTGRYELADARDNGLLPVGVVREVNDAATFAIQFSGLLPDVVPTNVFFDPAPPAGRGIGDWIPGRVYFVSSIPGMVQERNPALDGYASVPIYVPAQRPPVDPPVPADLIILPFDRSSGRETTVSATAPLNPRPGDHWFRTDRYAGLYVAVRDPTDTQTLWVQANA